ncbi:iron-regulated protein FrpC-like [Perca fluviatilis]|uniref:iron-regulated protein FrpC-like n=1 Tax=Perca fluviatilis TaxID=8168 RepID=UPI00196291EC|nr:iron-regulated protein FrpC-like [Perca fluviatilis]
MADWKKNWRLLILFSLLSLTELFEVRDEEWKELSPDIAALHQLRGLSEHMFHENIRNPPNHRSLVMDLFLVPLHRDTTVLGTRDVLKSVSREDIDQNPMTLLADLQENDNFTSFVIQKEQDFEGFLAAIDKQKTQNLLLSASEISHSYSQKLLVMTDKEKSSNDRVQQEYSMDPHYSVIVSNECLLNVSCVPEADSYTLVRIFGSVSEDGQTVSGLSGSSLAELMLKPSLETAPVFSLDGNTTKDFQHNLIRVFTARGIRAVLETTQENHQTYQVMNQLREVSGYQIPQRPVDHSTQYDHQQILILEDDPVVRKAATYLFEKHPTVSSVYVLDNNQRPVLIRGDSMPLTEDSRLVLVGHGRKDNSGEMRLGGYEVQDVSKIIQQTSRDSNKIKTISVVACDVGSDNAFIETLLKDLHETAGIKTELHIRDAVLQVSHTGEKITLEITKDGEQWRNKDDSKKVVATLDRNGDEDEAFSSVTEVRGSKFNDDIRGNKEHNVIVPGGGDDFIQGRGGEDWYVITPGQGVKTINNQSPDLALDILFLKHNMYIKCSCEGQSIIILVDGRKDVILQNWFDSKFHQHLQIKTSDGITAGLMTNRSSCDEDDLMFPITVDYRNQKPEPLLLPITQETKYKSFRDGRCLFCLQGKVIVMSYQYSVKEMYGSSGFDVMVGNSNDNLLDPYTGGALMFGGEGKDIYVIKQGYGNHLIIDNFAEDQSIDTVLVDMDYLHGSQVSLYSSKEDLEVTITSKGEQFKFTLLNYTTSSKYQHLEFQSSDGVNFKLKSLNSTRNVPFFQIEAFKVTLKQLQVDCRLDLNSQRNLSKVHTVQGCPSQSNDILGNDQDNALIGGWKDDALEGGAGDDTLIGGNGDDLLIGGLGDDTLYGEDGNDTMMGDSGQDVFLPGPGADLVDGGPGRDTVVYRGDPDTGKGVYVNLLTGQGRYADAEGDVLKDVEIVIGTVYSDILVSGYESSLLKGSDGNDILVSTGGDYLVGGDGNDIYMLAFNNGSVTVDNCAKDNATDVLYMSSQSTPPFDCQLLSDRVLLTFFGLNQTTVKITLQGWISDENECGHLKLVFRDLEVSVDQLLQECQLRQLEKCPLCWVFLCANKKKQQQEIWEQLETNVHSIASWLI